MPFRPASASLAAAADKIIEPAQLSAACFILVKKSQFIFFEFVEKLLPGNFFKAVVFAETGEIDSQEPCIPSAPGSLDFHRAAAPGFKPALYFVMIRRYSASDIAISSRF